MGEFPDGHKRQALDEEPAGGECGEFGRGDHFFDHWSQFLGLGLGGDQPLLHEEIGGHGSEQGLTLVPGSPEFSAFL